MKYRDPLACGYAAMQIIELDMAKLSVERARLRLARAELNAKDMWWKKADQRDKEYAVQCRKDLEQSLLYLERAEEDVRFWKKILD